jgi:hypothetical protein
MAMAVRSTMDQPGVYFTLDAPFVSIVGLYTNVLEGPGVISTQGGKYPALTGDHQLDFLKAELQRLAPARKAGERAVIITCHHPPVSVDSKHGGSTASPTTSTAPRARRASGPTPSSPGTLTSTNASPARSTGARSPTSSPEAGASPPPHPSAACQKRSHGQ